MDERHALDASSLMPITSRPTLVMARGKGSRLWDTDGRVYLDLVQGWAVNCLGHCPPEVVDALHAQALTLINPSPGYYNARAIELASKLRDLSGLEHTFFANSGAEANEGAIKLARKWGRLHRGGAFEIITTHDSFHGRTLATMAASGKPGWDDIFPPAMPGFAKARFGDLAAIDALITDRTCAVMVEPIQGEAGVIIPTEGYLRDLRALTRDRGILLIADEVQTGVARTGKMFGHQWEDAVPDIMTLGKGLGGGVPISALMARAEVSCFAPGDQGGTFNGNPLMTAVGRAVVDTVSQPAFLAAVQQRGTHLMQHLRDLAPRFGFTDVRGRGLLIAVTLSTPNAERVRDAALQKGLLINAPRPNTLRFMPALNITTTEINEAFAILTDALLTASD
jgi:acetylornithine/N-succinyldiaminopimelate aminotransferase